MQGSDRTIPRVDRDEQFQAMPEQGDARHQLAEPSPAYVDSGSYGAAAKVEPGDFGREIVRDGELDRFRRTPGPRGRLGAEGGYAGSGWSDDESIRAPTDGKHSERIREL